MPNSWAAEGFSDLIWGESIQTWTGEGMKRISTLIVRLYGESRAGSQSGPKLM